MRCQKLLFFLFASNIGGRCPIGLAYYWNMLQNHFFVGYWWSHVVISPDIRAPAAVICFLDHQLIPKPPNLRRYDRMCRVCIWNDAEMIIFIGLQLFESFFWHLALKNRLWRGMSWVEFTALTLFRDNLNWSELAFHGFFGNLLKVY